MRPVRRVESHPGYGLCFSVQNCPNYMGWTGNRSTWWNLQFHKFGWLWLQDCSNMEFDDTKYFQGPYNACRASACQRHPSAPSRVTSTIWETQEWASTKVQVPRLGPSMHRAARHSARRPTTTPNTSRGIRRWMSLPVININAGARLILKTGKTERVPFLGRYTATTQARWCIKWLSENTCLLNKCFVDESEGYQGFVKLYEIRNNLTQNPNF